MKKLWSFRNFLLAAAMLGCVTASAAAEAKTYFYYNNHAYGPPAPVRVYQPQVAYPSSCYYVHEDYLGHHTWRVKKECTAPQAYYQHPVEQHGPWYDEGYAWGYYNHHR